MCFVWAPLPLFGMSAEDEEPLLLLLLVDDEDESSLLLIVVDAVRESADKKEMSK